MDPRSKHNSAMHQFLISGRGAVAVEFAFVLPIILLIIWAFWQMSESYRLQWFESADCIACRHAD